MITNKYIVIKINAIKLRFVKTNVNECRLIQMNVSEFKSIQKYYIRLD